MLSKHIKFQSVPTDIIYEDTEFKRVWNRVITQRFFIEGVRKYGVYARPTGYRKDGKVYLLGHKSSLDALVDLNEEEIEMDIVDVNEIDIIQFLLIFLSREHKNLHCTREYIRLFLDYIETPPGKVWFKSILAKGDKEERLAHILDVSIYAVKCFLRLLQPGNERFAKMLDTKSLHAAITALNEAEEESGKRKPKDKGPKVTGDAGNKGPEPVAPPFTGGIASPGNSEDTSTKGEDEMPSDSSDDGADDTGIAEQDDTESVNWEEEVEKGKRQSVQQEDDEQAVRFIKKVYAVLSDDSQIDIVGTTMLTVDGQEIKSTERLAKHPNGHWMLPNHNTFYLAVQPVV